MTTPERWSVGEPNDEGHSMVVDCQDVTIATVWQQPLDPPEWANENAHLIATAPQLLSALKAVYDAMPAPSTRKLTVAWDEMRAAIKAAKDA